MKKYFTKRLFLICLALLFLLIAWNREINLLYGMFALLASTLIVSHLLPGYSLKGVTAERSLQPTAFEGDEIDVKVDLHNSGRTSRYMIEVIDTIPAAEPGSQRPMTFIARIRGRQRRSYSFKIECYKRGEDRIGPLALRSAYPLGISPVEKSAAQERPTLLVYPQVFDIVHLPLMEKGNMPITGTEAVSKAGGTDEFFGVREYRQGDSLRYIHWPSTAKHGRLIVKEFEIRSSTEVTILLDLHKDSDVGSGKETTLEYAVKVAASMAKYVLERGHSLQFIGFGQETHVVSYSKGLHQTARVLETLARVKADGKLPFSRAIYHGAELMKEGGTVVLFFSRVDMKPEEYDYSLRLLRAKRIRAIHVFIDANSFSDGNKRPSSGASPLVQELIDENAPVYVISKGENLPGAFDR